MSYTDPFAAGVETLPPQEPDAPAFTDPFAVGVAGEPGRKLGWDDLLWLLDTTSREIGRPMLGVNLATIRRIREHPLGEALWQAYKIANPPSLPSGLLPHAIDAAAPNEPPPPPLALDPAAYRAYWEASSEGGFGPAKFVLETVADPLTPLGGGYAKIGRGIARVPGLARVGRGITSLDLAYSAGVDKLLGGIGGTLGSIWRSMPFLSGESKPSLFRQYIASLLDVFAQLRPRLQEGPFHLLTIPGRQSADELAEAVSKAAEKALEKDKHALVTPQSIMARAERQLYGEIKEIEQGFASPIQEAAGARVTRMAYERLRAIANEFEIEAEYLFKKHKWQPGDDMTEQLSKQLLAAQARRHRRVLDTLESWKTAAERIASEEALSLADEAEESALAAASATPPPTGATSQQAIAQAVERAALEEARKRFAQAIEQLDNFDQLSYLRRNLPKDEREIDLALSDPMLWLQYNPMSRMAQVLSYIQLRQAAGDSAKKPSYSQILAGAQKIVGEEQRKLQELFEEFQKSVGSVSEAARRLSPDDYERVRRAAEEVFARALAERDVLLAGRPRFEAWLSPTQADFLRPQAETIQAMFDELRRDTRRIENTLRETLLASNMSEEQVKAIVPAAMENPDRIVSLLKEAGADPKTVNSVVSTLKKWSLNMVKDDPLRLIARRLREAKAVELGMNSGSIWSRALSGIDTLEAMMREEALMAPSTSAMNLIGGIFLGALDGTPPQRIMQHFTRNLARWRAGEREFLPEEIMRLHEALGVDVPTELRRQVHDAAGNLSGRADDIAPGLGERVAETATEAVNPIVRGAIGALQGASTLAPLGPAGAAAGALAGAAFKVKTQVRLARINRQLYDVIEGALRGARYLEKFQEQLQKSSQVLLLNINHVLSRPQRVPVLRPEGVHRASVSNLERFASEATATQVAKKNMTLRDTFPNSVIAAIRANIDIPPGTPPAGVSAEIIRQGALIRPDALRGALLDAGASPADATRLARWWEKEISDISHLAIEHSNKTNFDYLRTNNLEEFMRRFTWFPIWTMRATPIFIRLLVEHPGFILAINALDRISQEEGVPDTMRRFINTGGLGTLLANFLFGRAGMVYFNPLRGLIPMADAGRAFDIGRDDEGALAMLVRAAQAFGLGPSPRVSLPLQVAGLIPQDSLTSMRTSQLFEMVGAPLGLALGTGIDNPERPVREAVQWLKSFLGTRDEMDSPTGNAYKDLLIRRRIAEMAYQATGEPPRGVWREAQDGATSANPDARRIWELARLDIERQMMVQNALQFFLPARTRYLSDQERALRAIAAPIMDIPRDDPARQRLVEQFPAARALWDTSNRVDDAVQRALAGYQELRGRIAFYPAMTQRRLIDEYIATHPELARYFEWKGASHYSGPEPISQYRRSGRWPSLLLGP